MQKPAFCILSSNTFSESGRTTIRVVSNGNPLYCYFIRQNNSAALYVNNEFISYLFTDETDCIQYLGTFPMGETVTISVEADTVSSVPCYLDLDVFNAGAEILNAECLNHVTIDNAGQVTGAITCTNNGYLVTSIPASEGWIVLVDNTYVEYATLYDTFLMLPLESGDHTVSIIYIPPGVFPGLSISVVSLVVLFLIWGSRHVKS